MKTRNGMILIALLAFAQSASAFYDSNIGRWINRDPIGEQGGRNLYGFTLNNPNTWVDPYGLSTICFNVGFDTSAQATKDNTDKLRRSFDRLNQLLTKCCNKFRVGCGINVKANYDYNQKPAPSGGYGNDATVPAIAGGQGCVPILVTTLPINTTWMDQPVTPNAITLATGVIYNINNSGDGAIGHETGHYGGYDQGDATGDTRHSKDPNNPMHSFDTGGMNPDRCFCEKVSKLAK